MPTETANRPPNRHFVKRPDSLAMKDEVNKLKEEIKQLDLSHGELQSQINKTVSTPEVLERRKELQAELKELIAQQAAIKAERNTINDQIKAIDSQLKRKVTDVQSQMSKSSFKNVQDLDARVEYLDKLIGKGDLKLADERRYVKEMSALRKQRKDFGGFEKQQVSIDQDKARIAELKKKLSTVQNKEVQQKFEQVQKELNDLNSKNETVVGKRNNLFAKRNEIKKAKDEKYDLIRKLRADFDAEFEKFKTDLAESKKKREEEAKVRQAEEKKIKRKELSEKQLADASIPAFGEEISSIHNLLSYFDSSYVVPKDSAFKDLNGSAAPEVAAFTSVRKVEMPEGAVPLVKEQESYFAASKSKKTKQKKAKSKNFTVDPDIIVALSDLSIPLPTKQDEVAGTIITLKETLAALQDKQEDQTKVNIEKAKSRIKKLEEEEEEEASKDASPPVAKD